MSRASIQAHCQQCRADVIVGPDADRAALIAVTDPQPITRRGELLAACDKRHTYSQDLNGWLHHRDGWRLRSPAHGTVLAEHRCGQPLPDDWIAKPQPRPATPNHQEVPF